MDIKRIKSSIKVNEKTNCWEWLKSKNSGGYGQLTENKKYWTTHRYVYACVYGDIDADVIVRHLCHNRLCCNPEHLAVGSHKDNWHDSETSHKIGYSHTKVPIIIGGVQYTSVREAKKLTGLSFKSLSKFRSNGVFDEDAYKKSCLIAAVKPRILT